MPRDRFDNLKCPVPGYKTVIRAITGFQEIDKLRKHYSRVHLANISVEKALEVRAKAENNCFSARLPMTCSP